MGDESSPRDQGVHPISKRALQAVCKRGHDLTDPANVRVYRGHRTCRTCKNQAAKADRQDPAKRERILGYWRKYKKHKGSDPAWRAARQETARAARIKRGYGLTREELLALEARQNGVCAICRRPTNYRRKDGSPGHLAIDHDHATGQVRGLLCDQCNRLVGQLEKDMIRAVAAMNYIVKANEEWRTIGSTPTG